MQRGLPPLGLGIGVHRGSGIAGLIGSREKMEFAVVGGVVNVAARLQSHTRVTGVDILASRFVCDAADPRFTLHALPAAELRGINHPIPIFAVERFDENPVPSPS